MAINDISLTAGMRSNLLNLQNTVTLLNQTQSRLSSGNKVNSAIDNPTSFFASQALNSRASVIDSLKDAMGQAIQTVQSADKGIKAITSMIEQAKGIAQSALSAPVPPSPGAATGSIYWSGIGAGDLIVIGGVTFAGTNSGTPGMDEFRVSGNNVTDVQSLIDAINNHNWSSAINTFAAFLTYGQVSISSTVTATGIARDVEAGDFSVTIATHSAVMTIARPPHSGGTPFDVGLITLTGAVSGNRLTICNTNFTAVDHAPAVFDPIDHEGQFQVSGNDAADMQALADAINDANTAYSEVWPGDDSFSASFTNGTVILYRSAHTGTGTPYLNCQMSDFAGFSGSAAMSVMPWVDTTVYNSETLTLAGVQTGDMIFIDGNIFRADMDFAVGATDTITAQNLARLINANPGIKEISASANRSSISLTSNAGIVVDDVEADPSFTEIMNSDNNELSSLEYQYNVMRDQITALAEDSGYKGKDLLSATAALRALSVQFEGATLEVNGFDATANGLGLTSAAWTTGSTDAIDSDITLLDTALNTLRQGASALAGKLSVITVRQDFSTDMINTLTSGADKLTLADANEEGANMLMLQTRQSLSITALSLSAQAAQSVLRLFQ
jgi:flagellin